jgi:hypothetical protein
MYVVMLCFDAELMVQRSEHRKTKDGALNTRKVNPYMSTCFVQTALLCQRLQCFKCACRISTYSKLAVCASMTCEVIVHQLLALECRKSTCQRTTIATATECML